MQLKEEMFPWGFGDSQFGVSFIPRRRRYIIEEDDILQKEKTRIKKNLLHIKRYICNYIFFFPDKIIFVGVVLYICGSSVTSLSLKKNSYPQLSFCIYLKN